MDRQQYFRKFPITPYRGVPSLNILRRVDFNNKVKNFFTAFYAFDVTAGEKPETIAFDYYDDVDYDWLIYHTNDIIDPYHGVALELEDFENMVIKKYGSIERARKITVTYRTNYESDLSILPLNGTASYSALIGARKKYWEPVFTANSLAGYQRKKEDIYISTNRIISFSLATATDTPLTVDETVTATNGATATVASCTNDYVVLKHIDGDWDGPTSNFNVTGDDSNITVTFDYNSYKLIQHVIPELEQIYFTKYSAYDFLLDLNEQKRAISLVEKDYAHELNKQLEDLMK